jgi:hypothetical protein
VRRAAERFIDIDSRGEAIVGPPTGAAGR